MIRALARGLKHNLTLKLLSLAISLALWTYVVGAKSAVVVRTRMAPVQVTGLGPGLQYTSAEPSQVRVTFRGPRGVLQRQGVRNPYAEVDVSGHGPGEAEVPAQVSSIPRDVELVSIQPRMVKVRLERAPTLNSSPLRTLAVWPIVGAPPPGYALSAISVTPSTVVAAGSEELLRRLEHIRTEPLDISELRGVGEYTAQLVIPKGLRVLDRGSVTVTVSVTRRAGSGDEQAPAADSARPTATPEPPANGESGAPSVVGEGPQSQTDDGAEGEEPNLGLLAPLSPKPATKQPSKPPKQPAAPPAASGPAEAGPSER